MRKATVLSTTLNFLLPKQATKWVKGYHKIWTWFNIQDLIQSIQMEITFILSLQLPKYSQGLAVTQKFVNPISCRQPWTGPLTPFPHLLASTLLLHCTKQLHPHTAFSNQAPSKPDNTIEIKAISLDLNLEQKHPRECCVRQPSHWIGFLQLAQPSSILKD